MGLLPTLMAFISDMAQVFFALLLGVRGSAGIRETKPKLAIRMRLDGCCIALLLA